MDDYQDYITEAAPETVPSDEQVDDGDYEEDMPLPQSV